MNNPQLMTNRILRLVLLLLAARGAQAAGQDFPGMVSSASPEATAAGLEILAAGGNAVDAAIAVSVALGVTEPAGSGIAGQTVMLIKKPEQDAVVVQGSTWSPHRIPADATAAQLGYGHTAAAVPSTLRVLDLAHRKFGSGRLEWPDLLAPAIDYADKGFVVGPFRARSFRFYSADLARQPAARDIFLKADGSLYQAGDRFRQPLLATTLRRLAREGALDFYRGKLAAEIVADVSANGGWISATDLADFPEPEIVPAIVGEYRGYRVETLPPPFGGWVVLQALNVLEQLPADELSTEGSARTLALIDALFIAHSSRRSDPVLEHKDYADDIRERTAKALAVQRLDEYRRERNAAGAGPAPETGGETTHFSVVDKDGLAVAVTQSIDSYFGARVAHPTLGFLYNNYMQGYQVEDPAAPYYLREHTMPLSSMSATVVSKGAETRLVLGSPGSARIISAVVQVASYFIDVEQSVAAAVAAYRVHALPDDRAYVEGPQLATDLLYGLAERGLRLVRPAYGVSDSHLDPYFGGVHAIGFDGNTWTGAADPRRDGTAAYVSGD